MTPQKNLFCFEWTQDECADGILWWDTSIDIISRIESARMVQGNSKWWSDCWCERVICMNDVITYLQKRSDTEVYR